MPAAPLRVAIASDHAAIAMKADLAAVLRDEGHTVLDLGAHDERSVSWSDMGATLARSVTAGEAERGIALCGSGIGIAMAVNRFPHCRCANVSEPLSARLAREHNDANVLALGARLVGPAMARECVRAFLHTPFSGGRHSARVDTLTALPGETS